MSISTEPFVPEVRSVTGVIVPALRC